jgi:hypothetical protein
MMDAAGPSERRIRICLLRRQPRAAWTRFVRAQRPPSKKGWRQYKDRLNLGGFAEPAGKSLGDSRKRPRDSIFGHAAAHGVTQKPTRPINRGFVVIDCRFFFHESAR